MSGATPEQFIFCLTQVGSEKWLKKEIERDRPDLKFSYSRPGFLTFKTSEPVTRLPSFVFSKNTAKFAGKFKFDQIEALMLQIQKIRESYKNQIIKAHFYARDCIGSEEDPKKDPSAGWLQKWIKVLSGDLTLNPQAQTHDVILHLVLVEENELWLGLSQKRPWGWPMAGARLLEPLPADAPSRAYRKIEEAVVFSDVRFEATDHAIEVGSAPGGACFYLLKKGIHVTGIDRGEMAPVVADHPRFLWNKNSIRDYSLVEEDPRAQWVLVDMNTEPRVSVKETMPLLQHVQPDLLGVFFTLKLNSDAVFEDIPILVESMVKKIGLKKFQLVQLPSNRSEVCFIGVTDLGLKRLPPLGPAKKPVF